MAKTSFQDIIDSEIPVVIDFYADWCGPCKQQTPILRDLKKELGEQVKIVKIDVDRNQAISNKLGIRSIPTIMIFKDGDLKWQAAGVQPGFILKKQLANL